MTHLPDLIQDLALILLAAGMVTIAFKRLRQPLVLGYIAAGFLIGPHNHVLPTVVEIESIQTWAEIGVIFLLFGLGLEFSFKKLMRVGIPSSLTAIVEISSMLGLGYLTARALGWSKTDSVFCSGIIAISSTTIIMRAFAESEMKGRRFVQIVLGVLIVEDLAAVLLLVLLSTFAIGREFASTGDILFLLLKLGFFLALWFVSGIFFVPSLLRWLRPSLNKETLLVISLGLCLAMVIIATNVGFSPALGAFVMGSILGETAESEKILDLIHPVRDLFAAVYFVSVGMLIDPVMIAEYWRPIIIISLVLILGKSTCTTLGALLAGQSLRRSIQAGLSMAQIGEFSFIIASLGLSLKVASPFLYPVAVGVSTITAYFTPYFIRSSNRIADEVESLVPQPIRERIGQYEMVVQQHPSRQESKFFLRQYMYRIGINAVIVTAVFLLARNYLTSIAQLVMAAKWAQTLALAVAIFFTTPFIWAMAASHPDSVPDKYPSAAGFWAALEAIRYILTFALLTGLSSQFSAMPLVALMIAWSFTALMLSLFSKHLHHVYSLFERNFLANFAGANYVLPQSPARPIALWDAHITKLEIPANSEVIGKTLEQLAVREKFGVSIVLIERGHRRITAPNRYEHLYPHDRIYLIGTDEQIRRFNQWLEPVSLKEAALSDYSLHQLAISAKSDFSGKTILDSQIRERTHGLVVGIDRHGTRILNPQSTEEIKPGDLLWIVGETELVKHLN